MNATAAATIEKTPAADAAAAKPSGKRKIILLAVPLALAGLLVGLWFTGVLPRMLGLTHPPPKTDAVAAAAAAPIYVDLPEMVANLNVASHRPNYMKLVARVEVTKPEDVDRVKLAMPRLQDMFQTYLREMRPEELRGSAGTYRLREELIIRANIAAAPAHITDVLFIQMLIQ